MKVRVLLILIAILQMLDIKQFVRGLFDLQPEAVKSISKYQRLEEIHNNVNLLNLYRFNAQEQDVSSESQHVIVQECRIDSKIRHLDGLTEPIDVGKVSVILDHQINLEGTGIRDVLEHLFVVSKSWGCSLDTQSELFWHKDLMPTDKHVLGHSLDDGERFIICDGIVQEQNASLKSGNTLHIFFFGHSSPLLKPKIPWLNVLRAENKATQKKLSPAQIALGAHTRLETDQIAASMKPEETDLSSLLHEETSSHELGEFVGSHLQKLEQSDRETTGLGNKLGASFQNVSKEISELEFPYSENSLLEQLVAIFEETNQSGVDKHEPAYFLTATSVPPSSSAPVPVENRSYAATFNIQRIFLSYAGGTTNNTGYDTNYAALGVLLGPVYKPGSFLPLVDLSGRRYDDDTYGANGGVVVRYIPPAESSYTQILGFNLFYDFREAEIGSFSQVGVGFESLGTNWDFRANGYIPLHLTNRKNCFYSFPGGFSSVNRKQEFTYYGANVEVGYYIVQSKNFLLYAAGGAYGWAGKSNGSGMGGEFRIRPQYRDYIALDLRVTYDPIYNTVFQGEIIISFPLYQIGANKGKMGSSSITDRQVYQPVERLEILPYNSSCCWETNY